MKKLISFFALLINIAFLSYADGNDIFPDDIVRRLWNNNAKPKLTKLDYTQSERELRYSFIDGMEIVIHYGDDYWESLLVEITKAGETLYSFVPERELFFPYLNAIYQIQLSPDNPHTVFIESSAVPSSGLVSNMTWGILVDIESKSNQLVMTWGNVSEHFVDVDNDGNFEFVCVDVNGAAWDVENIKLIANIFSRDGSGFYTVNDSLESDTVFVLFYDNYRIEEVNWRETGLWLLKTPDLFEQNNISYGDN